MFGQEPENEREPEPENTNTHNPARCRCKKVKAKAWIIQINNNGVFERCMECQSYPTEDECKAKLDTMGECL